MGDSGPKYSNTDELPKNTSTGNRLHRVETLPYRRGVGVILFNARGQVFSAQRRDMISEAWQMPQGGIDEGETPLQAAFRELGEEIGTDKADVLAESREWYRYDLPEDLVPRIWGGRFRGQEQKWYAFRFRGVDRDINIETESPEFRAWRWAALEELPRMIVPFKRRLYERLVEEFSHLAKG